jgi:3-hydroxybutyryl-CoA dehydratase
VGFTEGQTASLTRTVTAEDVERFAEASGDNNPVHLDEAFAAKSRFGKRIAHGMLSAGYISALLGTKFPGQGSIYLSQTLKFSRPVYIGDTIEVRARVTAYRADKKILTLATEAVNQNGETVTSGEAVVLVSDVAGA